MPDAAALIASLPANGYELTVEEELGELLHVRVVETETSTAHRVDLPTAMLVSPTYSAVRRVREGRRHRGPATVHCRLRTSRRARIPSTRCG